MRRKIIAGNWKLNKTISESIRLVNTLKVKIVNVSHTDMIVCPTFISLSAVAEALKGSNIQLGAQNLFWEENGAFTGEISGPMLKSAGCSHVIIGHSERRQYFGETDETVNKRLKAAISAKLSPIVCVGETLHQREENQTFDVIKAQIGGALQGFDTSELRELIIAYEPVWAIGTGKNATPEQAQDVHSFIRSQLEVLFQADFAASVRIQYGGSVKPENADSLLSQPDIDGALVGGASLDADGFAAIIKSSENLI
ncbi:MAG: triose-phosphate isomerase [Deferribacteres bacterium]|nr:triose-phosphate isomerase [Deferribacteres bacterium]